MEQYSVKTVDGNFADQNGNVNVLPYKQLAFQLTGDAVTPTTILWQNTINLGANPTFGRISEGVYRIATSTPLLLGYNDFPVGYRSLESHGCKSDGISAVTVIPNLMTDLDNQFTFRVIDATTGLLTDDFRISISIKIYQLPPPESGE